MEKSFITIGGHKIETHALNTVVVGSGAAGFNAACRLHGYGQTDVAIVTEDINAGTSRNTGSDKQTYYKLTLSGGEPDSVGEMAKNLFDGGCMDGDTALCEAALSVQSFMRLAEAGVEFPRNRYGEYVGYKTDHDPRQRATSAGPYTSRQMTQCLEAQVREKGTRIFDKLQAIRILTDNGRAVGLLCLNLSATENDRHFVAFRCKNIVWATGGPAGMYARSVFPHRHFGSTGLAFEAGAKGQNLTEWQYGLASIRPRWNVSGTYMQVLPRIVSTDTDGGGEREFLFDFFKNKTEALTLVFLKGYQWPFDVRKVKGGSSIIDILVELETGKGRRVFLDFRRNPLDEAVEFDALSAEAAEYLRRAGACFGTPIKRLLHMNRPAADFYRDKGANLETEMLEIELCAQHNNGGIAVDCWWQSSVEGLFVAGEAAGTHGVYRPGGSALNSGQVGSERCAVYITAKRQGEPLNQKEWLTITEKQVDEMVRAAQGNTSGTGLGIGHKDNDTQRATGSYTSGLGPAAMSSFKLAMSGCGAAIRNENKIAQAQAAAREELKLLKEKSGSIPAGELSGFYRLRDMLISQIVYLGAMLNYIREGGGSRGSALYSDPEGEKPYPDLPDIFTFKLDDESRKSLVQEVAWNGGETAYTWREVRGIPHDDDFFENVWREYREGANANL